MKTSRIRRWPSFTPLVLLCAAAFFVAPGRAYADSNCFVEAGRIHHLDPRLLYAIAKVESGTRHGFNPRAINPASGALGVMQIIPENIAKLRQYDISEQDLYDPCTNINTGAWILSQMFRQFGPTWRAVGAYGVGNGKGEKLEAQRAVYAAKVRAQWQKMQAQALKAEAQQRELAAVTTPTPIVE